MTSVIKLGLKLVIVPNVNRPIEIQVLSLPFVLCANACNKVDGLGFSAGDQSVDDKGDNKLQLVLYLFFLIHRYL